MKIEGDEASVLTSNYDDEKRIRASFSIPEELEEEILSRLPVKDLTRFKCVCKSWCSRISSQTFIDLHHKNYAISRLVFNRTMEFPNSLPRRTITFVSPSALLHSDSAADKPTTTLPPMDLELPPCVAEAFGTRCPLLGGSCNGIVCLFHPYEVPIIMYNLATEDLKVIPQSSITAPEVGGLDTLRDLALGFDPKTNDYKVLHFTYHKYESNDCETELRLYSLRRDSWRKLDLPAALKNWSQRINLHCLPFTRNRFLCGLVKDFVQVGDNRHFELQLATFDMSSETFKISPVGKRSPTRPSTLTVKDSILPLGPDNKGYGLLPFKESMALLFYHKHGSGCDIWVLDDFFSRPQSRSWTRLWSLGNINMDFAFGFLGDHHFLFSERTSNDLKLLDLRTQDLVGHGIPGFTVTRRPYVYKESLVKISQF